MEKKAQVWIETVVYTLIGLAVIGILLGFGKPKIDAMKDKVLIEQTIESMNQINNVIYGDPTFQTPGNKRFLGLKVAKGTFTIDAVNNQISWTLLSSYKYSEIGQAVNSSNMQILTTVGGPYKVDITMKYSFNLTYDSQKVSRSFEASPAQYSLVLENKPSDGGMNIDFLIK